MRRRRSLLLGGMALLCLPVGYAVADYLATPGGTLTVFAFTCFATKACPASVPMTSAGTELMTAAQPAQVTLANTGANATALNVSGTVTANPGNVANTTPWLTTARTVGGAGATLDFAGQNAAGTISSTLVGGQFNTVPTTVTSGNFSPLQIDPNGNLKVNVSPAGGNVPVSMAVGVGVDGWDATQGGTTNTAYNGSGNATVVAALKGIYANTASPVPAGTNLIGSVTADPCGGGGTSQGLKKNAAIGTAGATNVLVVTGVAAQKVYICSLVLIVAAPAAFSVIEGTGGTCATGSAAILGSTTAANGMPLASNGGLTIGGANTIGVTATAADSVCISASTSVAFGGNITYVQQ